ncbi:hypothetical protein BD410DRAFT_895544 [Rickenella mellea]|uniref:RRM domain-containing protein n=1 Tax=Rickenella mellea TaxID=50990 RepID=A0A4Y7QFI6_9AGAM|nr:hypothetical protein BD410DRAFT_895544 [Rickenella mellea]
MTSNWKADWASRVVDVHTWRSERQIRDVFSTVGEIRRFYPWGTGRTDKHHFFIEYSTVDAAQRASELGRNETEVQVHSLAANVTMQGRFCALVSASQNHPNRCASGSNLVATRVNLPPTSPKLRTRGQRARSASPLIRHQSSSAFDRNFSGIPGAPVSQLSTLTTRECQPRAKFSHIFTPDLSISTRDPDSICAESEKNASAAMAATQNHKAPAGNAYKATSRIPIVICSETIWFDLETLEDDPSGIISTLKQAHDASGSWIMVGAHYRRAGMVDSALMVITSFLQEMGETDTRDSALKPAYLLLSRCYSDLAHKLLLKEGNESDAVKSYREKAQEWIQRIYGNEECKAKLGPLTPSHLQCPARPTPVASNPDSSHSDKENKAPPETTVSTKPAPSLPDRPKSVRPADDHHPSPSSAPPPNAPTTTNAARIKLLQTELQTLRDRQLTHATVLSEAKAAKRKAEDTAAEERSRRRKLQRRLEEVEAELEKRKESKEKARHGLRREGSARKPAEEKTQKDELLKSEQEESMPSKTARMVFGEIASLFSRAAQTPSLILGLGPDDIQNTASKD